MGVILPVGVPWDPRNELPPTRRTGLNGCQVAWGRLVQVITQVLPACWSQLLAAIQARSPI